MSDTDGLDTVTVSATLRLMRSAGRFFVGRSSAEHRDGAIKSTSTLPPSGTLSMFSCPLCLILSYRVYTAAVLVALNIFFHPYPSSPSSYLIFLLSPSPLLSTTSLLLLSQSPRISTAVSTAILSLMMMYSSSHISKTSLLVVPLL